MKINKNQRKSLKINESPASPTNPANPAHPAIQPTFHQGGGGSVSVNETQKGGGVWCQTGEGHKPCTFKWFRASPQTSEKIMISDENTEKYNFAAEAPLGANSQPVLYTFFACMVLRLAP